MDLVDQLTEELTCQQVMLSSLEGESFDGVEAERDEITTDIARLERLLERAQRGEDAIEDAVGEPATEDDGEWSCSWRLNRFFFPFALFGHIGLVRQGD